ncbi:sulfatase-like hydrolase/transferase [Niabella ginsengisoli]|uniref:Sulfatase-like hydrolase/transferase n=1 Tax=Niabella ginsengisoli TaxID=522298 RepID=A0ABS9SR48_9BACT|nr:sulfatase-like hydrolase/transferase [Niabella ginsengisoli]
MGCYGNKEVHTPNIDQLANASMLFKRQYVAVPTCGASRASILTGMYPQTKIQIANNALEKTVSGKPSGKNPETFVEQFKRNGYYTVGIGKISHSADGYLYEYDEERSNKLELPNSWDEMLFDAGKWKTGWNAFFGYQDGSSRTTKDKMVKPYEAGDCDDEGYVDGLTAKLATEKIKMLAQQKQPFFWVLVFLNPTCLLMRPKNIGICTRKMASHSRLRLLFLKP